MLTGFGEVWQILVQELEKTRVSLAAKKQQYRMKMHTRFYLAQRINNQVTRPTILLADDDSALLESLRKLLECEFHVLAAVANGQALVEAAQSLHPDLVVADISMPLLSGFQAARRIKAARSDARVIFLTMHEEPAFIVEARKTGAYGYVIKRCIPSHLIPAIRKVLQGSPFVGPSTQSSPQC